MGDYFFKDGELYHAGSFKYLKREWKNGRWQYTYDLKSAGKNLKNKFREVTGKNAKANLVKADNKVLTAQRNLAYAKDYKQHVDRTLAPYMEGRRGRSANMSKKDAQFQKSFEKRFTYDKLSAEKDVSDRKADLASARKRAEDALKKYESTPLGKLENIAKKGKALVDKIVSKITGKQVKPEPKKDTLADERARNERRMEEVRAENKRREEELKKKKYIDRTRNSSAGPNSHARTKQYKK